MGSETLAQYLDREVPLMQQQLRDWWGTGRLQPSMIDAELERTSGALRVVAQPDLQACLDTRARQEFAWAVALLSLFRPGGVEIWGRRWCCPLVECAG